MRSRYEVKKFMHAKYLCRATTCQPLYDVGHFNKEVVADFYAIKGIHGDFLARGK
jgi:hypothetical protein